MADFNFSFFLMFARWTSTVFTLRCNFSAISRVPLPSADKLEYFKFAVGKVGGWRVVRISSDVWKKSPRFFLTFFR